MSKMQRPIDCQPRDMFEKESIERFIEGLRVSISCSREMQFIEPKMGWDKVTEGLVGLLVSGKKLAKAKAVTRQQLLADAATVQKKLDTTPQA